MSYQVKVEYSEEKWISFFVNMVDVHCDNYTFQNLVVDIASRCPSLSHLTTMTMRIRYRDDEGNYVNINYGDDKGYREMWNNAFEVDDRDYKRLKLKAGEINSPYARDPRSGRNCDNQCQPDRETNRKANQVACDRSQLSQVKSRKQLNLSDEDELFLSPVERMLRKRDDDIKNMRNNIQEKKAELQSLDAAIAQATRENSIGGTVCGKCHLRAGHTKRNCTLESCDSVRSCGFIDKHSDEKAKRKKLASDIASLETNLKSAIEAKQSAKNTHDKLQKSFAARIEQDVLDTNPNLYIQNGVKNWSLVHKHVAVLENLCQGKLPRRQDIPQLLKTGLSKQRVKSAVNSNFENPRMEILVDHGIKFPKKSRLMESVSTFSSKQEEQDFMLAVEIQNNINQEGRSSPTVPVTPQSMQSAMQYSYPNVNQQIQVLLPREGTYATQQTSNWQVHRNSVGSGVDSLYFNDPEVTNVVQTGACSITGISDASITNSQPMAQLANSGSCSPDILASAALMETNSSDSD